MSSLDCYTFDTQKIKNDWVTLTLKKEENLEKTRKLLEEQFNIESFTRGPTELEIDNFADNAKSKNEKKAYYFFFKKKKMKESKHCFWFPGIMGERFLQKIKKGELNLKELQVNISRIDIKREICLSLNEKEAKKQFQILEKKQRKEETNNEKNRNVHLNQNNDPVLSIGNRKNANYARIYKKKGGNLACEIELKGSAAKKAAKYIETDQWDNLEEENIKTYGKQVKKLAQTKITKQIKDDFAEIEEVCKEKKETGKKTTQTAVSGSFLEKKKECENTFSYLLRQNEFIFFNRVLLDLYANSFDTQLLFLTWILLDQIACKPLQKKCKTVLKKLEAFPFRYWQTETDKQKVENILTLKISRDLICEKLGWKKRSENYRLMESLFLKMKNIQFIRNFHHPYLVKFIPTNASVIDSVAGLDETSHNPILTIKFNPVILSYYNERETFYPEGTIQKILSFFKNNLFKNKSSQFVGIYSLFHFGERKNKSLDIIYLINDFFPPLKRDRDKKFNTAFIFKKILAKGKYKEIFVRSFSEKEQSSLCELASVEYANLKSKSHRDIDSVHLLFKCSAEMREARDKIIVKPNSLSFLH